MITAQTIILTSIVNILITVINRPFANLNDKAITTVLAFAVDAIIAPKVDDEIGQIQFMKALKKIIDKSDIADIITPTKKPMITVVMLSVCMACMCLCCMTSQRAVQHDIAGR